MSIAQDLNRTLQPPTVSRCEAPPATPGALNKIYFGFTGGFLLPATTRQGVNIRNLYLGSE